MLPHTLFGWITFATLHFTRIYGWFALVYVAVCWLLHGYAGLYAFTPRLPGCLLPCLQFTLYHMVGSFCCLVGLPLPGSPRTPAFTFCVAARLRLPAHLHTTTRHHYRFTWMPPPYLRYLPAAVVTVPLLLRWLYTGYTVLLPVAMPYHTRYRYCRRLWFVDYGCTVTLVGLPHTLRFTRLPGSHGYALPYRFAVLVYARSRIRLLIWLPHARCLVHRYVAVYLFMVTVYTHAVTRWLPCAPVHTRFFDRLPRSAAHICRTAHCTIRRGYRGYAFRTYHTAHTHTFTVAFWLRLPPPPAAQLLLPYCGCLCAVGSDHTHAVITTAVPVLPAGYGSVAVHLRFTWFTAMPFLRFCRISAVGCAAYIRLPHRFAIGLPATTLHCRLPFAVAVYLCGSVWLPVVTVPAYTTLLPVTARFAVTTPRGSRTVPVGYTCLYTPHTRLVLPHTFTRYHARFSFPHLPGPFNTGCRSAGWFYTVLGSLRCRIAGSGFTVTRRCHARPLVAVHTFFTLLPHCRAFVLILPFVTATHGWVLHKHTLRVYHTLVLHLPPSHTHSPPGSCVTVTHLLLHYTHTHTPSRFYTPLPFTTHAVSSTPAVTLTRTRTAALHVTLRYTQFFCVHRCYRGSLRFTHRVLPLPRVFTVPAWFPHHRCRIHCHTRGWFPYLVCHSYAPTTGFCLRFWFLVHYGSLLFTLLCHTHTCGCLHGLRTFTVAFLTRTCLHTAVTARVAGWFLFTPATVTPACLLRCLYGLLPHLWLRIATVTAVGSTTYGSCRLGSTLVHTVLPYARSVAGYIRWVRLRFTRLLVIVHILRSPRLLPPRTVYAVTTVVHFAACYLPRTHTYHHHSYGWLVTVTVTHWRSVVRSATRFGCTFIPLRGYRSYRSSPPLPRSRFVLYVTVCRLPFTVHLRFLHTFGSHTRLHTLRLRLPLCAAHTLVTPHLPHIVITRMVAFVTAFCGWVDAVGLRFAFAGSRLVYYTAFRMRFTYIHAFHITGYPFTGYTTRLFATVICYLRILHCLTLRTRTFGLGYFVGLRLYTAITVTFTCYCGLVSSRFIYHHTVPIAVYTATAVGYTPVTLPLHTTVYVYLRLGSHRLVTVGLPPLPHTWTAAVVCVLRFAVCWLHHTVAVAYLPLPVDTTLRGYAACGYTTRSHTHAAHTHHAPRYAFARCRLRSAVRLRLRGLPFTARAAVATFAIPRLHTAVRFGSTYPRRSYRFTRVCSCLLRFTFCWFTHLDYRFAFTTPRGLPPRVVQFGSVRLRLPRTLRFIHVLAHSAVPVGLRFLHLPAAVLFTRLRLVPFAYHTLPHTRLRTHTLVAFGYAHYWFAAHTAYATFDYILRLLFTAHRFALPTVAFYARLRSGYVPLRFTHAVAVHTRARTRGCSFVRFVGFGLRAHTALRFAVRGCGYTRTVQVLVTRLVLHAVLCTRLLPTPHTTVGWLHTVTFYVTGLPVTAVAPVTHIPVCSVTTHRLPAFRITPHLPHHSALVVPSLHTHFVTVTVLVTVGFYHLLRLLVPTRTVGYPFPILILPYRGYAPRFCLPVACAHFAVPFAALRCGSRTRGSRLRSHTRSLLVGLPFTPCGSQFVLVAVRGYVTRFTVHGYVAVAAHIQFTVTYTHHTTHTLRFTFGSRLYVPAVTATLCRALLLHTHTVPRLRIAGCSAAVRLHTALLIYAPARLRFVARCGCVTRTRYRAPLRFILPPFWLLRAPFISLRYHTTTHTVTRFACITPLFF